ncbi:glutamate 5-kinase [Helicobacter turcicus]|uniref:Glutamate 5-kinase n=1 Tax=Helicobacter turcicus TaxID=2867412 RepID=A0ABS7JLR8_9HELI|nr:glutamate 5-kinase [Helicobacter turcicus]MBX7490336.1 glutamate 5-kinase [Helicobacter turcicus]MBX7545085.1 glutamate 5-kinase [Helicobacter turcicus]
MQKNQEKNNRIVIKVGSAILVENQSINFDCIEALAQLIAKLRSVYEVILVSSGAVAAGYTEIKLDKTNLSNKQALAAIGQPLLMQIYANVFEKYQITTAQVLLTAYDFDSRKHTQNARNAMEVLLSNQVLPIINENDVIATGELKYLGFGDNDQLSAHVAHFFDARLLAILSDIDAYFEANPKDYPNAKMRKVVTQISDDELCAEFTPNNQFATGGIVTKLKAAKFLLDNQKEMFLSSGKDLSVLHDFLMHNIYEKGTLFTTNP